MHTKQHSCEWRVLALCKAPLERAEGACTHPQSTTCASEGYLTLHMKHHSCKHPRLKCPGLTRVVLCARVRAPSARVTGASCGHAASSLHARVPAPSTRMPSSIRASGGHASTLLTQMEWLVRARVRAPATRLPPLLCSVWARPGHQVGRVGVRWPTGRCVICWSLFQVPGSQLLCTLSPLQPSATPSPEPAPPGTSPAAPVVPSQVRHLDLGIAGEDVLTTSTMVLSWGPNFQMLP